MVSFAFDYLFLFRLLSQQQLQQLFWTFYKCRLKEICLCDWKLFCLFNILATVSEEFDVILFHEFFLHNFVCFINPCGIFWVFLGLLSASTALTQVLLQATFVMVIMKELFLRFPQKILPIKVFRHCFGFIEPKYEKKVTDKKAQMECRMGGQLDG